MYGPDSARNGLAVFSLLTPFVVKRWAGMYYSTREVDWLLELGQIEIVLSSLESVASVQSWKGLRWCSGSMDSLWCVISRTVCGSRRKISTEARTNSLKCVRFHSCNDFLTIAGSQANYILNFHQKQDKQM